MYLKIRNVLATLPAKGLHNLRSGKSGILNRAGRCNRTLTFILSLTGRGDRISTRLCKAALTGRGDRGRESRRALQNSVCLLFCGLALAGCAQQGGGLLQPTPKQIISGKNTIVPSAAALSMEATNFCNAQAQVDYAGLVLYCEGKTPALPLSISTTYETEASQFSCQVYGYTNSSNQLIVPQTVTLGNCPTGAAPAPVTAPSGAATVKS